MWDRNLIWKGTLVLCYQLSPPAQHNSGKYRRGQLPHFPTITSKDGNIRHVSVSHAASCPTTFGFCVFPYLSIPPELYVKGSIQTIYDKYIAAVYNKCLCFHFSLLYVPHPI